MTAQALRSVRLFLPRPPAALVAVSRESNTMPALRRILARADASRGDEAGLYPELLQAFAVSRQRDWPAAAFSWLGEGASEDTRYRLRADPVHLRADRDVLVLNGRPVSLAVDEAKSLVEALNTHFEPDGLRFAAMTSTRWYVAPEHAPELTTRTLEVASGRSVDALLPTGADALRWHRYSNEIQMLFHTHPVNVAREEAGLPIINSVWFWGGGTLPETTAAPVCAVWANDPIARGLALAARVPCHGEPATLHSWLQDSGPGEHLIWLGAPDSSNEWLERNWFESLLAALGSRSLSRASIVAADGDEPLRLTLVPGDRWKFWRRGIARLAS